MNFMNNLESLIKVKTIVTLPVIFIFAVLALRSNITLNNVMIIVFSVLAFYFCTYYEKKNPISEMHAESTTRLKK